MSENEPRHDQADSFAVSDLDYHLPEELIAQEPAPHREDARLLLVERQTGRLSDAKITDLPAVLRAGDLLILNDTKVLPAKFVARRRTGGVIPGLFLSEEEPGRWRVMLQGSRRLRVGEALVAGDDQAASVELELLESLGEGHWVARVTAPGGAEQVLSRIGQTPLPPYIRRDTRDPERDTEDRRRYQTVYARQPGAVAAPTAGLHLTTPLIDALHANGIKIATVTLHVGMGTFKPIATQRLADHKMHSEWYELLPGVADAVQACRKRGGRVVAVGTTSVRVLESAAIDSAGSRLVQARTGTTEMFIYPPYEFRVVDAMMTNFHLPRTTLLALVMARAGIGQTRGAYRHAVEKRYRFYSYGDAMLIY
ncbi:MAG: tRNA preQ1(34) S-adenosylmethionine ribosyltransferase-isomerase QueA [Phycisphaerales bacterium]|nr:MAG: tRNA preQ1(34) S-adenosylmethionine ribosyltransferase-isomerase QueA [Phycisphaerales bacterium]